MKSIMQHPIDPKVDCVFKALLGAEANNNLLIHFLNAMLMKELDAPITQVNILNPYNEKEYLTDKLSIVDVKARDEQQRLYQIEIQLLTKPSLPARILYNWAVLYSKQLSSGQDYTKLHPAYSIWLLAENLLPETAENINYVHDYQLRNEEGQSFIVHGGIWLFELQKFAKQQVENEQERWLKFFQDAEQFTNEQLPTWMQTNEMRQAMETLKRFSDKEHAYEAYQARMEYIREQNTTREEMETAIREKEAAIREKEAAVREKEAAVAEAVAEIARLKVLLSTKS